VNGGSFLFSLFFLFSFFFLFLFFFFFVNSTQIPVVQFVYRDVTFFLLYLILHTVFRSQGAKWTFLAYCCVFCQPKVKDAIGRHLDAYRQGCEGARFKFSIVAMQLVKPQAPSLYFTATGGILYHSSEQ